MGVSIHAYNKLLRRVAWRFAHFFEFIDPPGLLNDCVKAHICIRLWKIFFCNNYWRWFFSPLFLLAGIDNAGFFVY